MKRMPFLQLIAAAALIVLHGTNPAWADSVPAVQVASPAAIPQSPPPDPIRVAWDRVGAIA